jgi:Trypsin-like peptidase domain
MSRSLYLIACVSASLASGPVPSAQARPEAESEVFERARRSVFLVETESGHGSGFLVDASGLVLTNHHVLGSSRYVAVGIDPLHKYPASVVAREASRDVALIRVHPRAVEGLSPLRFIDSGDNVKIGERVLAIGSALIDEGSVLTTGMVSRVGPDTIIADLNVNPGSSGGPLLNLKGEVVGICTFLLKAAAGPGLAGVIRGHVARPVVATVSASLVHEPPSFERLPVAPRIPYPAQALRERAAAVRDASAYRGRVEGMRIDVLTPPIVYFEAHQQEIRRLRKQNSEQKASQQLGGEQPNAYVWQSHTGQVEAIVGIRVVPEERGDFVRMRLLRDGVEAVPIVPGRFCEPGAPGTRGHPARCFGLYQYLPETFAPGAQLALHVYSDDAPEKPRVWKLRPALVDRVRSDFAPWFATAGGDVDRRRGWMTDEMFAAPQSSVARDLCHGPHRRFVLLGWPDARVPAPAVDNNAGAGSVVR